MEDPARFFFSLLSYFWLRIFLDMSRGKSYPRESQVGSAGLRSRRRALIGRRRRRRRRRQPTEKWPRDFATELRNLVPVSQSIA